MREAAFVKQNKDKWLRFENILSNNTQVSPDEISNLYVEITAVSYTHLTLPTNREV